MSAFLLALLLVLAAAFGWVACAVFGALTENSCRRGQVDFTAAAARGDLLHLDWSDARELPHAADPDLVAVMEPGRNPELRRLDEQRGWLR